MDCDKTFSHFWYIKGSKTLSVIKQVVDEVRIYDHTIEVELLDLKNYKVQFCDGRNPSTYDGNTRKIIDMVYSSDFYIIGAPIFQGSITGVLKNLFDLVTPSALRNKVMGFIATRRTYKHYLVIQNQLKPKSITIILMKKTLGSSKEWQAYFNCFYLSLYITLNGCYLNINR